MAFKMKGFPKHKGAKAHVGNRKGSAVFEKQYGSAFPKPGDPEKVITKGEEKWEDWQIGETTDKEDGGTTRTDTRKGTQETTIYTPPSKLDPEWYNSLTPEQRKAADDRWRKANTKVITEDLSDERVEETPPAPVEETPTSQYRTELIMDPGSTAGSRVSGQVSDPSGVMGIKVFGPGLPKGGRYLYHDDARGYSGKSGKFIGSIDELSQYEGLDYDAIMAESGYGGGGTGEDLEIVKRGGSSAYKKRKTY